MKRPIQNCPGKHLLWQENMSQTYTTNDPAPSVISTTEAMSATPKVAPITSESFKKASAILPEDMTDPSKALAADVIHHIQHFVFQGLSSASLLAVGCFTSESEFSQINLFRAPMLLRTLRPEVFQAHAFFYLLTGKFSRISEELEQYVKQQDARIAAMDPNSSDPQDFSGMFLFSKDLLDEFKAIDDLTNFKSPKALEELDKLGTLEKIESYKADKRLEQLSALNEHPLHEILIDTIATVKNADVIANHVRGGRLIYRLTQEYQTYCDNRDLSVYPNVTITFRKQFLIDHGKPIDERAVKHHKDDFDDVRAGTEEDFDKAREYKYNQISDSDFDESKKAAILDKGIGWMKIAKVFSEDAKYDEQFSVQMHCDLRVAFIKKILGFHNTLFKAGLMDKHARSRFARQLFATLAYALLDPRSETKYSEATISGLVKEIGTTINSVNLTMILNVFKKCEFYKEEMLNLLSTSILKSNPGDRAIQIFAIESMTQIKQQEILNKEKFLELSLRSMFRVSSEEISVDRTNCYVAYKLIQIGNDNPHLKTLLADSDVKEVFNMLRVHKGVYKQDKEFVESLSFTVKCLIYQYCV